MNPSIETGKEELPNLPNTLREYQHANPDEDNQKILRNMSRALAYTWEVLQGGNIEKTQPKKKENIEKHLRGFLYESFTIHDEKGLNIAITDITQYVINENVEKFVESFLGIFGITLSGAMFLLGRAQWTPIDTNKCVVEVGIPQRIKDEHAKVQEATEHALRMSKLFDEVDALPKAVDTEEAPLESNPEDESINNLLEYIQRAMSEFRVDILEIPVPFLQDLFLFLKLRTDISKLEEEIRHKEHLKSQIDYGRQRINAILYPQDQNRRRDPDRRRIRRIERLSEENSAERREQEIQTINLLITKKRQELSRKKTQFNKCRIQSFPTNLQIIEGIYTSFGLRDKIPQVRNIRTTRNPNDIRKITIRGLLQIANIISKEEKLSKLSLYSIQEVHRLDRIRLSVHGDASKIQNPEHALILEEWGQAKVQTVLTTTIALMVSSIDNTVQYSIKPDPKDTSKEIVNPSLKKEEITSNGQEEITPTISTSKSQKEKRRREIQDEIKKHEKILRMFTQHYHQQIKNLAIDIARIKETIKSKRNGMQPKQSQFSDLSEEELSTILDKKESQLMEIARKSTKKMVNDEIGYRSAKTELGLLQRRLKRLSI